MVEHNLAKVGVESSNLFSRSKYGSSRALKPHFTVRLFLWVKFEGDINERGSQHTNLLYKTRLSCHIKLSLFVHTGEVSRHHQSYINRTQFQARSAYIYRTFYRTFYRTLAVSDLSKYTLVMAD